MELYRHGITWKAKPLSCLRRRTSTSGNSQREGGRKYGKICAKHDMQYDISGMKMVEMHV